MIVQPNTSFETVNQFATGLTGTVGVRVIDNAGATTIARVTAGIVEYPAGSGIYQKTLTSPATSGGYTIVWDDTSTFKIVDLLVSGSTLAALTGNLYVTADELKAALNISDQDFADDDVNRACNAASRAIDLATGRFFYSTTDTRYYTPEWRAVTVETDDIQTISTLQVDLPGTGTYTTWTENTDFTLQPANSATNDKPYERVRLRRQRQSYWPTTDNALKITGTFGWAEIPSEVNQYAVFLAEKLLYRTRHAPFGIIQTTGDIGSVARLARTDPDFDTLVGHLVKTRPLV